MFDSSYSQSKAANLYLANEYERRYPDSGILSIAFNPGNIRSEITRHVSIVKAYMVVRRPSYTTRLSVIANPFSGRSCSSHAWERIQSSMQVFLRILALKIKGDMLFHGEESAYLTKTSYMA